MAPLEITLFTDPACPFAFSAEPVRIRLRWHYGDGLRWTVRMIVLTREPGEAEKLAEGAPNLQRLHGMPIDPRPYPRAASSEPACRAVVAAREHAPERAEALLRRLRVRVMTGGLVDDPELIRAATSSYPGRVVVALDAKGGYVASRGWSEVSAQRAVDLARSYQTQPVAALLYTDIERDGTEVGPNIVATAALAKESGLDVLASGGVGTLEHVRQLARASREVDGRIRGVVLGRALHERRFSLEEAIAAAAEAG